MTPATRLLRDLIALPSVNPAFVPPDDPRAGEARVAGFLASVAARGGLDVGLPEALPGRPNLIARLSPTGRIRKRILLAPHLDTVGGGDEVFQPRLRAGRLHGRGACDTKGCVATMLTAVLELARSGARPTSTEIIFAGLADEENAQGGSRALVKSGFRADLAIVGEPTRLQVVTAHKGDVWIQLETRGRSAHGSRPHLGVNAVHEMARIVHAIESTYARQLKRRHHPVLGRPTVNVGTITGGTQPNIVPDRCHISVDRRTIPGETPASVQRELKQLLADHGLAARFLDLRNAPCPALETDPRQPLVAQFLAATGGKGPLGVDYFCDAAVLAAGGTPSVVFGPGDIAQAHTADEWIEVRQLGEAVALLLRFLRGLP